MVSVDVVWLHLGQVELLRTQNRAWSGDSDPSDERFGRDLIMLHSPKANERTGSPQSCFAVDGNGTFVVSFKVIIYDPEKVGSGKRASADRCFN